MDRLVHLNGGPNGLEAWDLCKAMSQMSQAEVFARICGWSRAAGRAEIWQAEWGGGGVGWSQDLAGALRECVGRT